MNKESVFPLETRATKWSAGDTNPEARELHQRAAAARAKLRQMCDDNTYLVIVELEDAIRTLTRLQLEDTTG